jgi:hypothetical protein
MCGFLTLVIAIGVAWLGGWTTSAANRHNRDVLKWLMPIATLALVILLAQFSQFTCRARLLTYDSCATTASTFDDAQCAVRAEGGSLSDR